MNHDPFQLTKELRNQKINKMCVNKNWLVVSTPLKNISQWEGLSHILWKIKNVPNHQSENDNFRSFHDFPAQFWGSRARPDSASKITARSRGFKSLLRRFFQTWLAGKSPKLAGGAMGKSRGYDEGYNMIQLPSGNLT